MMRLALLGMMRRLPLPTCRGTHHALSAHHGRRPHHLPAGQASFLYPSSLYFVPSHARRRPSITPMAEAIMRPRVQPEASPRQKRPPTLVFSSVSSFTLLL